MSGFQKFGYKVAAVFKLIVLKIKRAIRFVTTDVWTLDITDLSKWKARLVKDIKTFQVMMNTFREQKMGFQISALSFQSTMAIDTVMKAAGNIISTAQSGLFGFISMLTFVWIVIWLMMRVEMVFNNAWKVEKPRKWWRQIGVILIIFILSPFVIAMFFSGTIVYSNVLDLIPTFEYSDNLKSFLSWVVFAAIAVFIISLMYKYIPACKVRYKYALKASIYAGIIFTALQYLYLETTVMVAKSSAVYGVLAAVPLFMVWLSSGWSIIIYGAELAYGFQTVEEGNISVEDLNIQLARSKQERRDRREEVFSNKKTVSKRKKKKQL